MDLVGKQLGIVVGDEARGGLEGQRLENPWWWKAL